MRVVRAILWTVPIVLLVIGCVTKPPSGAKDKELAEARYKLGVVYFNDGKFRLAIPEFGKAIELNPSSPDYRNALGMALMFNRQLDDAIKVFEEALTIDPKSSETKNNLASAYLMKGELEPARVLLLQVKDDFIYPTPHFVYFNLARIYERQGKIDKAIEEYGLALDIRPDYVDAHYNVGLLFLGQGKTDLAIAEFIEVTRLSPGIAVYHRTLGVAYVQAGKPQDARRAFQKVLEVGPNSPSAKYARKMLQELQ